MKPITIIAICVICAAIYGCSTVAQSLGDDEVFYYDIDWKANGGGADSRTLILVDAVEIREVPMLRVYHAHTRISWGIGDHDTMHTVMLRWSDVCHSYYLPPGCYIQYLPELICGYPPKAI